MFQSIQCNPVLTETATTDPLPGCIKAAMAGALLGRIEAAISVTLAARIMAAVRGSVNPSSIHAPKTRPPTSNLFRCGFPFLRAVGVAASLGALVGFLSIKA